MSQQSPKVLPASRDLLGAADRVGVGASVLCAIHCAMFPIVLGLAPALGLKLNGWVDFDQAFVVFATLLGATTLSVGYRRHRAMHAWALLLPGLALVWAASFTALHNHTATHLALMVVGGVMMALAHLINLRLTHVVGKQPG